MWNLSYIFVLLQALVEYYRNVNLNSIFTVIDTTLAHPYSPYSQANGACQPPPRAAEPQSPGPDVKVLRKCRALFDYSANQVNQLSIQESDTIYVISTAGESRGWWKGWKDGQVSAHILNKNHAVTCHLTSCTLCLYKHVLSKFKQFHFSFLVWYKAYFER